MTGTGSSTGNTPRASKDLPDFALSGYALPTYFQVELDGSRTGWAARLIAPTMMPAEAARRGVDGARMTAGRLAVRAMRKRGKGRIVNCSSAAGFTALPFGGAYTATKHALGQPRLEERQPVCI